MNGGTIWWAQIGTSLKFLDRLIRQLQELHSVILNMPERFPWRHAFYDAVDQRRSRFCGERRLKRLPWNPAMEPGAFVLKELCPQDVQADYWPSQTYGEYIGSQRQLMLNDYFVWVTGIHTKSDMLKWQTFLRQYENALPDTTVGAVFVLEYDGSPLEHAEPEPIVYQVERYDCQVFCLEAALELQNTALQSYQAQVALCVGNRDPELCGALLETGEAMLQDPIQTVLQVLETVRRSDGTAFPSLSEQRISSAIWEAAIITAFPLLERFRTEFVNRNAAELRKSLPIENSNGDSIREPSDLEIGTLDYISYHSYAISQQDKEMIHLCRTIRNLLAHNHLVPYEQIKIVFESLMF
jgi:hypothetical protein